MYRDANRFTGPTASLAPTGAPPAEAGANGNQGLYTNLNRGTVSSLFATTGRLGFGAAAGPQAIQAGGLILWEADKSTGPDISQQQADKIEDAVRRGGALLLTLGKSPGTSAIRLSPLLPTLTGSYDASHPPIGLAEMDASLYPPGSAAGRTLPFFYPVRPFAAVERGQARYERYAQTIPFINLQAPANHHFWTRSLLNRQWRVRISGDDIFGSPLLVTGLYGAGRVAVFGSSASSVEGWPDAAGFWYHLLNWLCEDVKSKGTQQADNSDYRLAVRAEVSAQHSAKVTIENTGATAFNGLMVSRALSWEGTLLKDANAEAEKPIRVAAGSQQSLEIALPLPSATGYLEMAVRDAFLLRLGLLTENGARLVAESKVPLSFDPAVKLAIRTDDLNGWQYPFAAPGPDAIAEFSGRMGSRVGAYAYPPGATVQCEVTVSNGVRNVAPEALAADETQPQNQSVMALNDGSMAQERAPADGIQAYGMWTGKQGVENVVSFTFPQPVQLSAVVLVGMASQYRNGLDHNPGAAIIEIDGALVGSFNDLDTRFLSGFGRARLEFKIIKGTRLRLRLPWVAMRADRRRAVPWLGEVELEGVEGAAANAASGSLVIALRDALGASAIPIATQSLHVASGETKPVRVSLTLPSSAAGFYSLEAAYAGSSAAAPILAIKAANALLPRTTLIPPGAPGLSSIVTRGFRNCFPIGVGTAETHGSWEEPDDLVWAYSRNLKQEGKNTRTEANRLYVTASNLQHYSTPWAVFMNGEDFFAAAAPNMVAKMKSSAAWASSDVAVLQNSDRWDSGPQMSAMYQWQEFVEFDAYLRSQGGAGLQSRIKTDIAGEIQAQYSEQWQQWHLDRYVGEIRTLREAFAKEGKKLVIAAQGLPMVAGPAGAELAQTIQGSSDDSTWGMASDSVPLTTGRQLGEMAFNPVWKLSTLMAYGFDSATLNSPQWHAPAGTTEPTRRHCYDRAWRATVWPDGRYGSVYTYGYGANVGIAYTMNENDWQQWWELQQRHSLIAPEAPIGAGLVLGTGYRAAGKDMWFSGGGEVGEVGPDVMLLAQTFRLLHEAGLSLPFAANIAALDHWTGTAPLIVVNLAQFTDAEVAILEKTRARGVKVAAFSSQAAPTAAGAALLRRPGVTALPGAAADLTPRSAAALASSLQQSLDLPLQFPKGVSGYGFQSAGINFIVVEDWMETGGVVEVRLRARAGASAAQACNVNDHRPVQISKDGASWWKIEVPMRPGDGTLIAVEEK